MHRMARSSWVIFILLRAHASPAATCLDARGRDEPISHSPTQPHAVATPSHAASRAESLPAQAAGAGHTRARPHRHSAQRGPGAPAPARSPEPGTCRATQGGPGLFSPSVVCRGPHRLSRCRAGPQLTRCGPGDPERAVSANAYQLGDETRERPPAIGPPAQGPSPEPGTVFAWLG